MMDPAEIYAFATELGDAARASTLRYFRKNVAVDNKWQDGFDPVTQADRETELVLRELIAARFPDHAIVGEEFPARETGSDYCWILDPIDGTRHFITGVPLWGVLVGLLHRGKPVFGMMDQPFSQERFLGGFGDGWHEHDGTRTPLRASNCTALSQAVMTTTDLYLFNERERAAYDQLQSATKLQRYGLDCYGMGMIASGHVDLYVDTQLKDVDIAPLIPVIEAAGGVVCNWRGEDASKGGQAIVAATEALRDAALKILSPAAD